MTCREIWAIVLAAGRSTRMGRCKAALPWLGGHTLLSYQVAQWQQAQVRPLVVLGAHNPQPLPPEIPVVVNPDPEAGKTRSILLGLGELPPCAAVAISAVDQPRSAALYHQLVAAHRRHRPPIVGPRQGSRLGHPLLFDRALLPQLRRIDEATQGLRQVVRQAVRQRSQIAYLDTPDQLVHVDLNTPEAYRQALAAARNGPQP